jgi:hypothetical protein
VGPRAVLDAVVKRKIPSPRRESNLRTPLIQPVAQRCTELSRLLPNNIRVIKSRRMNWEVHVALMGDMKNVLKIFVGNPEGKRSRVKPRCRRVYNTNAEFRKRGCKDVDLIYLALDRV